jgi:hypothetical protein
MMMESEGGGAIPNLLIKDGQRRSVFRSYVYPMLDRPNLTVLTGTTVTFVLINKRRSRTGYRDPTRWRDLVESRSGSSAFEPAPELLELGHLRTGQIQRRDLHRVRRSVRGVERLQPFCELLRAQREAVVPINQRESPRPRLAEQLQ